MDVAYDVLVFYGALAIWAGTLVWGFRARNFWPFLLTGLGLAVFLNGRYFVEGHAGGIAFFIGIYDVFDNLGLGRHDGAPALAQCVDNACTVWGNRYVNHPSWGVAFFERFTGGNNLRNNLLYAHIGFNSITFVLLHYQLWKPGTGSNRARHRVLGRISFASITAGTFFAVWLSSEHGDVGEYGGLLAEWGFYSMSAFVYGAAVMSVLTIRRGDVAAHRKWTIRWAGSMWGAFWLFRVLLVVTGPLLRSWESASLLISIWFSAPLGIAIAEYFRRRPGRRPIDATTQGDPEPAKAPVNA